MTVNCPDNNGEMVVKANPWTSLRRQLPIRQVALRNTATLANAGVGCNNNLSDLSDLSSLDDSGSESEFKDEEDSEGGDEAEDEDYAEGETEAELDDASYRRLQKSNKKKFQRLGKGCTRIVMSKEEFDNEDFVRIWCLPVGGERWGDFAWQNERHVKHFYHQLRVDGWDMEALRIPAKKKRCGYWQQQFGTKVAKSPQEEVCTYKADSPAHFMRHFAHHWKGLGYFYRCPACGTIARREDNYPRHLKYCIKTKEGPGVTSAFEEDYKHNFFLRCVTPALTRIMNPDKPCL